MKRQARTPTSDLYLPHHLPRRSGDAASARLTLPPDLQDLTDAELGAYLLELLRESGEIDTRDIRIIASDGAVTLDGSLPTVLEHQWLRSILEESAGISIIVDRLRIKERHRHLAGALTASTVEVNRGIGSRASKPRRVG
jgi:hypothetical protein